MRRWFDIEIILSFDNGILEFIQTFLRCGLLDWVMPYITILGDKGWIWIAVIIVFLARKETRIIGIGMLIALLLSTLAGNYFLKPMVGRIRPYIANGFEGLLIAPLTDFSFPSGHTMSAFSVATTLWLNRRRLGRWAFLIAALIAFSRLYLYVHYPTDVLAGLFLGLLFGFCGFWLQNRIFTKNRRKKEKFK